MWRFDLNRRVLLVGGICVAALALVAGGFLLTRPEALHGAVIDPPLTSADFSMADFNGDQFTLSQQRGKVVVLYFGYTNCPDECPLTLAHLKLAVDLLGAPAENVRVVMITTDPARDTPDAMKAFLGKFSPAFVGLVGSPAQLAKVWQAYGVTVENGGQSHSNFVYVIDANGQLRETFLPDSLPADEAADIASLLRE